MRKILAVTCLVLILITSSTFFGQFLKVGLLLGSPYAFWQGEKLVGIDYDIWKSVAKKILRVDPKINDRLDEILKKWEKAVIG